MAKRHSPGDPPATPSREKILAFIAREREAQGGAPQKIGKREIARAFGLKGAERIGLKKVLRELEAEGEIEKRGRSLASPGRLPPVTLCDVTGRDRDGELIATPTEWDAEDFGAPPKVLIPPPRRPRPGEPVPGVGDRALLRVEPLRDVEPGGPQYTGRVIKLVARAKSQVLGIFRAAPGGGARVIPVDKRARSQEYLVAPDHAGAARDGDLVAIEVQRSHRFGPPQARVREKLGSLATEKAVSLIAIHAHQIPNVFAPAALAEAERAEEATMRGREDWRALPLVTIDPADAKDYDDAVHAAPDPDPANPGGHILTVAIADVAAYVRVGSALDREALERGNSVYFPDRVVPMLPERISNDLCSLKAGVDRPALAVRMTINASGRKLRHSFHRVMIRSAAKLAYPQAQAAIDGDPDDTTRPLLEGVLRPLWAAYQALSIERDRRSPLDLDLPERRILLKPDGTVDRVVTPPRLDAHKLIEEFMILANVAAAETLEDRRQPLIYRAHDEPTPEKLNALAEFLASIGVKMAKGQVLKPANFNHILAQAEDGEHENVVNEIVLRTQAQAEYTAKNYGHFGLSLRRYAHFTSPIRRYADLIVHRALVRALDFGDDGLPDFHVDELEEIAARISVAERRAMKAERESHDRLIAAHLADRIGAVFNGRISGVTRAGLFVKLEETGADGFIPAGSLGSDYFRHDERQHALVGARTGETHRLGDAVEVKLLEAAPFAGALRFELMSEGSGRRGRGGPAAKVRKSKRSDRRFAGRAREADGKPARAQKSRR